MELSAYKNIFSFDIRWTWKTISLLAFLAVLPNVFGLFNYTTQWGFKIHFFQYLMFLAAIIYGPIGGVISGAFGSVYTAIGLHNPYIIVGNMILGFFFGFFVKYRFNVILAALCAYLIQLPWLWVSDIYWVHMPLKAVQGAVIALFVSDILMAGLAGLSAKRIKGLVVST